MVVETVKQGGDSGQHIESYKAKDGILKNNDFSQMGKEKSPR
jgi:hypothetical protein